MILTIFLNQNKNDIVLSDGIYQMEQNLMLEMYQHEK